jgi:hypothetical protein
MEEILGSPTEACREVNLTEVMARRPTEVFPGWLPAQRVAARHATRPLPSIAVLRSIGFLEKARANRIVE